MKRVFALVVCLCMVFAMVPAVSAATGDVSLNGNAIYTTVEEALAAAKEGDTVSLNADVTAGQVIVPQDVTLDLGGYNLTANLVVAMNGVIYGGNVAVAEDMLKVIGNNDGNLAVWNGEGYSFALVEYQQKLTVAEDGNSAQYIFVPYMDEATTALLADGGADNGISIKVQLTWNGGASVQYYTFSEDLIATVYGGNYEKAFSLTVRGIAGIEDMVVSAVVESAAGGFARNEDIPVAPSEPEAEMPSGEIEIESYGNAEWVAPQDGYVKFTINIPGAKFAVLDGWTPVAEGVDSITAQVVAGTTYGVYPNYDVTTASVVTWEYVEAPEGGDDVGGDAGEVVPSGEALALGNNNVTLTYATMPMMAPYWTYTATESGNLTVTVESINGETNLGMGFGRGAYTLLVGETDGMFTNTATVYMNAGESVEIRVLDSMDMTEVPAVINLSFVAGGSSEPSEEKNPADYFETNDFGNYIIGSLESPVDIFVGNDDIYYYYVAEADGNVIATATVDEMTGTNYWFFVNGVCHYNCGSVNVAAGDEVLINVWGGYEGTISFEAGEYIPTEPAEPEETEPALPGTMDNPYVIDELPYNVYFWPGMDEYYSYITKEEGTIIVSGLEGALLSLPWGDYWENDENGNYIIPVIADYELMMNFWTLAEEIDGFMTITFQPAASAEPVTESFDMADLEADAAGGTETSRELGDKVVFTISSGWFNKEARIYKNANGVLASTTGMSSVTLNVGYKDSTFNVYVSENGETWTEYQMDVAYTSAYSDVTIDFENPVKYVMFDAPNAQIRIKTISITFVGGASEPSEPEVPVEPSEPEVTEPVEPSAPVEPSEPEVTEPVEPSVPETSEPPVTEPVETEPAGFQVVDAPVAGIAYKFGMIQKNVSETDVYYLNGNISGYYMATTTDAGAAVDVYLEETEGGYYLYAMVNGAKQYINMVVNDTHVNGKYEDAAATVYTYNEDSKTVIAVVNDADYWMGTRNDKTYTTVGPVKTSYNGFYMQFYAEAATEPEAPVEPSVPDETEPVETEPVETEPSVPAGFQVVDAPVAGVAYKFGMIQKNVSETDVYYLDGNISGYYMATTTDTGVAVDVYLEETEGGYYLYAMVNGAKQYINMVVNDTHVNGKYEDAAATVYTYNEDSKTVIAVVNDADYWMGTRNDKTYTTVGPVKTSYNGFYMQFYAEAATEPEAPVEPSVPDETEPVETEPVETEPVETEPVETEPVETEPVETEPVEGAETTVSKTVAELITEYGWTNATTKQSFTLDDVVSVKINGGSNTGKAYNGNQIRIYATDTPAGTITISVEEGYELVSVKISTETGTYASLCVDGTTEDICNTTATVSGTSVVLNSVKVGTDGKQVRVTAIEVTYK